MEFRHLRYFITVAEEQNFSRAAERLNIAQPPLSQQIRDLEEELGFSLFDRSKRQLQLTQAGQWFLERAYRIFNQLEIAKEDASKISRGEIGQLTVGYVNFAFFTLAIDVIKVFQSRFPNVQLILREMLSAEQYEALMVRDIDAGIAILPVTSDFMDYEEISDDEFMVALPENHRMADQESIHLEDLSNESFILVPHQIKSIFADKVLAMCHRAGFTPRASQEIIQMSSGLSMVAAGVGIALMPGCVYSSRTKGVVFKPIFSGAEHINLAVAWRKADTAPVLQSFLNVVREIKKLQNFTVTTSAALPQ